MLPNASQHLMCTLPVRSSENTKPVGPRHKQNMQVKNQDKIPKTENLEKRFQGNEHIFNNTTKYETRFSCKIHNGRTDQKRHESTKKISRQLCVQKTRVVNFTAMGKNDWICCFFLVYIEKRQVVKLDLAPFL